MSFTLNPPTIHLDQLNWNETGSETDPRARLTSHIRIGPLDMHLEAWEVEDDTQGNQSVKPETFRETDFDSLCMTMNCAFTTAVIYGREYVLIATPYGR